MQSRRSRLDRFISARVRISLREVKLMLAQQRVTVDGKTARDADQIINAFSHIQLDGEDLQADTAVRLMMHKPVGVVSATRDARHTTVLDLLPRPDRDRFHIAGRLDLNSSGLMLLTNDGEWSRKLTSPEHKVCKIYRVRLRNPIHEADHEEYIEAFAQGMYFSCEGITTRPAKLTILCAHTAEVILTEGRYHQIKRMFGRFRNPVLELHRTAIGGLQLDAGLAPGESRELSCAESLLPFAAVAQG
jgi:16S rRNA pseudouridine516 synthase